MMIKVGHKMQSTDDNQDQTHSEFLSFLGSDEKLIGLAWSTHSIALNAQYQSPGSNQMCHLPAMHRIYQIVLAEMKI